MGGEAYFTNVMASNLVISLSDFYKGSETSEGGVRNRVHFRIFCVGARRRQSRKEQGSFCERVVKVDVFTPLGSIRIFSEFSPMPETLTGVRLKPVIPMMVLGVGLRNGETRQAKPTVPVTQQNLK